MKDGEIKTSSRGGQDYDIATTYIKQDPFLLEVFNRDPNIILDGEIYRHGWNLSTISGLCRLDSVEDRHKGERERQLCIFHPARALRGLSQGPQEISLSTYKLGQSSGLEDCKILLLHSHHQPHLR